MLELGPAAWTQESAERPIFHIMPARGWLNDPNGPVYANGRYHIFYQHVVVGCEWDFGIVWGHAASKDLIHWERLPAAIRPSPGGTDADGCFSGCCTVDSNGVPTILYTAVRLRSNPECGPLPTPEFDLQLPFIETQCIARANPAEDKLVGWTKDKTPFMPLPPASVPLTGWRDPYLVEISSRPPSTGHFMLMGAGIRDQGGCVLKYSSNKLDSGWEYQGLMCVGDASTGAMWECPLLVELNTAPVVPSPLGLAPSQVRYTPGSDGARPSPAVWRGSGASHSLAAGPPLDDSPTYPLNPAYTHMLCVSPDTPANPVLYWLGTMGENDTFKLEEARGPIRLDLGDVTYAPNTLIEASGRSLLWAWIQERRKVGTYDYAGCLSVPRVLYVAGDRLLQQPVPEVDDLRSGMSWHGMGLEVAAGRPIPLQGVNGLCLDLDLTFVRGSSSKCGVLLHSWNAAEEGSAAVLYDWEAATLNVVFEAFDPSTLVFTLDSEAVRTIGGPLSLPAGDPLQLRLLIDHSAVEIFTGSGEVLSTRMYRGAPSQFGDSGIEFVSYGGTAELVRVDAYEMGTIWKAEANSKTRTADDTFSA